MAQRVKDKKNEDMRTAIAEIAYSQLGQHYLWDTQGEKFGEGPVVNSLSYPNAAYTTWYKENTTEWKLKGGNHFYCQGRSGQMMGDVLRPITTRQIHSQETATNPIPADQTINGESCAGKRHFDCSGLVYWVYNQMGVKVQRLTASQYYDLCKKITRNQLNRGDLVFLKDSKGEIHHVGILYSMDASNKIIVEARGAIYGVVTRTFAQWIATGETVLYGDLLSQLQRAGR